MNKNPIKMLQRGPFEYAPANIRELRFASAGEVDRSFTVLIASRVLDDFLQRNKTGIAVFDNDNAKIVFDGLHGHRTSGSKAMLDRLDSLAGLDWTGFSKACRVNRHYCGDIADIDIDCPLPNSGNSDTQQALGINPIIDNGSDSINGLANVRDVSCDLPPKEKFDRINKNPIKMLQRGPFEYAPANIRELRFASAGEVDRSFTVLIASRVLDDFLQRNNTGIAVFDNDNDKVVFDGLHGHRTSGSKAMLDRLDSLAALDWTGFSNACRVNRHYCGGIADIDINCPLPNSGDSNAQQALGINPIIDNRSDFIRELANVPDVPYDLPSMERIEMFREINAHLMFREEDRTYLAWDIRLNMKWNKTGHMDGMPALEKRHDKAWSHLVETDPTIIQEACREVMSVYVDAPTSILDMEEFPCEFILVGRNNGFLGLQKFHGQHMEAIEGQNISDLISDFNDAEIEALWVICRVLNDDLSAVNRSQDMEYQMHLLRRQWEKDAI